MLSNAAINTTGTGRKALWQARDIVVNRKTGKRSFELTLGDDSADIEVITAGWKIVIA